MTAAAGAVVAVVEAAEEEAKEAVAGEEAGAVAEAEGCRRWRRRHSVATRQKRIQWRSTP